MELTKLQLVTVGLLIGYFATLIIFAAINPCDCDCKQIKIQPTVTKNKDCLQHYSDEYQDIERIENLINQERRS